MKSSPRKKKIIGFKQKNIYLIINLIVGEMKNLNSNKSEVSFCTYSLLNVTIILSKICNVVLLKPHFFYGST